MMDLPQFALITALVKQVQDHTHAPVFISDQDLTEAGGVHLESERDHAGGGYWLRSRPATVTIDADESIPALEGTA